jgi:hypothetical protein
LIISHNISKSIDSVNLIAVTSLLNWLITLKILYSHAKLKILKTPARSQGNTLPFIVDTV